MSSQELAMQIPTSMYVLVGTFLIANIGSIVAFFWGGIKMYGKAVEWKTIMEHRVSKNEKDIQNAWSELKTKQDKVRC